MKRTSLIAGGSLQQRLQAAELAWHRKDYLACLETLQEASRLAPANTAILLQLGRVQGLRYDYAGAQHSFEQALRLATRKTEMLTLVADYCQNFRNPDLAEHYLRCAIEQPDATTPAYVKLAELCERLRRLPEATQLIEQALKLHPGFPAALLVRARLERTAGQLEVAEQVLRSFITKPVPDLWVRTQTWYELATILDRQGRYDEAMAAFLEAKNLLRPQAAPHLADLKLFRARLKVMESNVSAELFQRWTNDAPQLAPARRLALLYGHARSGTTLLEQVLDSHPDIASAEETEIFIEEAFTPIKRCSPPNAFMLPALEAATFPTLRQVRAAYFHTMELCLDRPLANHMLIDKNPMYSYMIPGFIRIFPETKFLVAMRDPRDVVISCFMQPHQLNAVTSAYLNLETTVEDYAAVMSIWRTLAPLLSGRFLEVRYEDMVDNLEAVARRTLEFLGVPWHECVLKFDEHARHKIVFSPTYADVTQPVFKRAKGRWQNYQKYLEPHLPQLEPFVKAFGYA